MRTKMNNRQQQPQNTRKQQQQLQSTDDEEEEDIFTTSGSSNNNNNINTNDNNSTVNEFSTSGRRNLEFAQKLGYSDLLIHSALTRLGAEAKQNELLAELIKLSADTAPKSNAANTAIRNASGEGNGGSGGSIGVGYNMQAASVGQLRHIVIDGSNVALSHGNNEVFSCRGIRICIDWFRQRGHKEITAFVPNWRKESVSRTIGNNTIAEQELLYELERERVLVFTPSRLFEGKRVACYDDRYILKLAAETDGIVVSNDNYRDLLLESAEFRKVVQERLLMYSFVNDRFMPPDDPLGRSGPTLDVFLRMPLPKGSDLLQLCPYGKKCTYGVKCKFRHQPATHSLLQRKPLGASISAPINFNSSSSISNNSTSGNLNVGGGLNNNSNNKLALSSVLSRTKSNTLEQQSKCNQLGVGFNMATSTPNNAIWAEEQQLSAIFGYQLELNGNNDELNPHKKLQRQVPRVNGGTMPTSGYEQHRLLVPTISAPAPQQTTHSNTHTQNRHQQLTRIISAPVAPTTLSENDSYPQAMPTHNYAFLSASDSRINEELHPAQTREEKRRLLRFHLSSLFPQNQVHAVLQMYPDETDAKTVCAAIINLFPHN